jgi:hypothetical protein
MFRITDMKKLILFGLAFGSCAQTPVHAPKDKDATLKVWQMLADYHAGESYYLRIKDRERQLVDQLNALNAQIEAAKKKLCAPNEKLTDRLMCAKGGK